MLRNAFATAAQELKPISRSPTLIFGNSNVIIKFVIGDVVQARPTSNMLKLRGN